MSSPVFAGEDQKDTSGESIFLVGFWNEASPPWQAWWSGINGIVGEGVSISTELIKDPRWKLLVYAAGYGVGSLEPDAMFRHATFMDIWNSPQSIRIPSADSGNDPRNYQLTAIWVECERGVNLWRVDEYGVAGFTQTSFRPINVRGSGNMIIWGVFDANL